MSDSAAINRQTVRDLARLARLDLTPDEEVRYQRELGVILEFVNQLERVDVADYAPLHQVTGLTNRWRADELGAVNSAQQPPAAALLADLADRLQAGQFRVPRPLAESPPKQNHSDGPTAA